MSINFYAVSEVHVQRTAIATNISVTHLAILTSSCTSFKHKNDTKSIILQVKKQIEYVDSIIGMMMNGLVDREIHNCVNVIVVADHGKPK